MMLTFSTTGPIAGVANRWKLLRMPIASADKLTNATYGKMILFKKAVVSSFPGVTEKPLANRGTTHGENTMPKTTTAVANTAVMVSRALANSHAFFRSPSIRYLENTGMNAAL